MIPVLWPNPRVLRFTVGTACAGGNHFHVQGRVSMTPEDDGYYDLQGYKADFTKPLTSDEESVFLTLLFRLLVGQLQDQSAANIKAVIEQKVIDLAVNG